MYAAIDIPRFALQSVARLEAGLGNTAMALVDTSLAKPAVIDCTHQAAAQGVEVGSAVSQAIARCEDLAIRYRSSKAETMAGRVLFDSAYSLSPRVEESFPGLCTIGLAGVNRTSLASRCEEIVSELRALGLKGRMGVAPTPDLALLAARQTERVMLVGRIDCPQSTAEAKTLQVADDRAGHPYLLGEVGRKYGSQRGSPESASECRAAALDGRSSWGEDCCGTPRSAPSLDLRGASQTKALQDEDSQPYHSLKTFLGKLPLEAAEPSEEIGAILQRWGIRTAGAFVDLSRVEVGKRLGTEGLRLWDRISGEEERPLRISEPPKVYEESLEFEYEIETLEPLLFLMRRFLDQLCLRLLRSGLVADALLLKLDMADIRLEDGERVEAVELRVKIPEPTCDADALFLLLATRLEEIKADAAVVGLSLRIDPVDRNECQLGLFETSLKNSYRFTQTLSRVAGIVGEEGVGRPRLPANGRPDGATMERLPSSIPPMKGPGLKKHFGLAMRRFRPPLKAEVRLWERQPVWMRCAAAQGVIVDCRGPWAHSGQWWDEQGWNRVEWDVELKAGGAFRLVKERGAWVVEGMYD